MKNEERKYIFLDVDGTLYSPKTGEVPADARKALFLARKRGHRIFLCTGRSLAEASAYLNMDVDGFILGAGAMIYADGKKIHDHPIPTGDITRLKKLIHKHGLGYSLEGSAGAYGDPKGYEALLWYFSGGEKNLDVRVAHAVKNCTYPEKFGNEESDSIYKVCAFGHQWDQVFPDIRRELEAPYVLTRSFESKADDFCIGEITDSQENKATGIRHVLDHYNADSFDAYGFGDSENDIPMFTECRIGVAMGNGTDAIREKADYVTTDILNHGIWNAFVHFGLIEGKEY